MDYIRNPDEIYRESFATIAREADFGGMPADAVPVATRMVHACGMIDLVKDIRVSPDFVKAAKTSIADRRPIFVDAEMVKAGIIPSRVPNGVSIICTLNDPRAKEIGIAKSTTRSAAAIELWKNTLEGALVAIGNAPTALFALLEMIDGGGPKPAAIIGVPVGFVGAAESKAELHQHSRGIPYLTVLGRRGGTATAAAAINALLGDA